MVDLYSQYLDIQDDIDNAIHEVIKDSDFIRGQAVEMLEHDLSLFLGVRHCITCGSGTDALQLALMAIGVKNGDEVIIPSFSFGAVAETVALLGGTPVFADVEDDTFNISPASVERLISKRTKALIPVHLFGQPCDMAALSEIARNHSLTIIEDNAQSLGSKCLFADGTVKYAGTIGHIGCTSFFPSKVLGCFGDGGAIFTNDDILAKRVRTLANHGQEHKYDHIYIGINSRLDTIQAAVLRAKLPHLEKWIDSRRTAAERYTLMLDNLYPAVTTPFEAPHRTHVYHQYTIKVADNYSRDVMKASLAAAGIPSMVYYPVPLFMQPAYRNISIKDPLMKNVYRLTSSVLSLPMHSELTLMQQKSVTDILIRNISGGGNASLMKLYCYAA